MYRTLIQVCPWNPNLWKRRRKPLHRGRSWIVAHAQWQLWPEKTERDTMLWEWHLKAIPLGDEVARLLFSLSGHKKSARQEEHGLRWDDTMPWQPCCSGMIVKTICLNTWKRTWWHITASGVWEYGSNSAFYLAAQETGIWIRIVRCPKTHAYY